jgi:hypothetical protein
MADALADGGAVILFNKTSVAARVRIYYLQRIIYGRIFAQQKTGLCGAGQTAVRFERPSTEGRITHEIGSGKAALF